MMNAGRPSAMLTFLQVKVLPRKIVRRMSIQVFAVWPFPTFTRFAVAHPIIQGRKAIKSDIMEIVNFRMFSRLSTKCWQKGNA
jgi:hypothetical protein